MPRLPCPPVNRLWHTRERRQERTKAARSCTERYWAAASDFTWPLPGYMSQVPASGTCPMPGFE